MAADESGATDDEEALRGDGLAHGAGILIQSVGEIPSAKAFGEILGAPEERPGAVSGRGSVDSHLVADRLRRGWLTRRCQTTAQSPSVCGVIRSGDTVGMTTQASAAVLVAPPSLPTMPKTAAPRSRAELEGAHQVHRDVLLAVAAADREDQQRVVACRGARP